MVAFSHNDYMVPSSYKPLHPQPTPQHLSEQIPTFSFQKQNTAMWNSYTAIGMRCISSTIQQHKQITVIVWIPEMSLFSFTEAETQCGYIPSKMEANTSKQTLKTLYYYKNTQLWTLMLNPTLNQQKHRNAGLPQHEAGQLLGEILHQQSCLLSQSHNLPLDWDLYNQLPF